MPTTAKETAVLLEQSEEGRAFLQRRAALFLLVNGLIGLGFLVYRFTAGLALAPPELRWKFLLDGSMFTHLAATAAFSLGWLALRDGVRPLRTIRLIEVISFTSACGLYMWMASYIPLFARPDLIVILVLTFVMFARSMFVPSTARLTAVFCGLLALPLFAVVFVMYLGADRELYAFVYKKQGWEISEQPMSAVRFAVGPTIEASAWWTAASALAIATSSVIYGLRRQVREITRLGQYTLGAKIGEGGMGVVFRARHAMLRRPTAVKLLPPEKAGERSIARFEREVQNTAALTHPNTITIYDYGRTPDGIFYYAMEFLDGCTITDVVEGDGPQPGGRVVRVLRDAAGALAEAHATGLIHRDIKPANIMLLEQGGVPDVSKVLDFGLVKAVTSETGASLTQAGVVTGTPQYMSPEAISDPEDIDGRSDLYSLAAVGYYLLTGQHVFEGNTAVEVCSHHLHTEPIPPSERLGKPVDPALASLIMRCLRKNPKPRPQSAEEFLLALRACDTSDWSDDDAAAWWATRGVELRARRIDDFGSPADERMPVVADDRSVRVH